MPGHRSIRGRLIGSAPRRHVARGIATGIFIAIATGIVIGLVAGSVPAAAEEPRAAAAAAEVDQQGLAELVPFLVQVVNLAVLDPILAASLVPEAWIDSLVEGALEIEAEVPEKPSKPDAPLAWPVGPWLTPDSLVTTIKTARPEAVRSLYRALEPRVAASCRRQAASSWAACERAMRASVARLSHASVLARSVGGPATPITATQREVARLGEPVVVALRDQCRVLGRSVWGEDWSTRP